MNFEFFEKALKLAQKRESLTFGELKTAFGMNPAEAFDISDWTNVINALAENGLGLAPNRFLFEEFPSSDCPMFPYESSINHLELPTDRALYFHFGLIGLTLGCYIFSGSGFDSQSIDRRLWATVEYLQNSKFTFSESDRAGLRSNIDYLLLNPPEENFVRKLGEDCPEEILNFIQVSCFMFLTSKGMDMNEPKVKSIATKTAEMFDLEQGVEKLHEIVDSGLI